MITAPVSVGGRCAEKLAVTSSDRRCPRTAVHGVQTSRCRHSLARCSKPQSTSTCQAQAGPAVAVPSPQMAGLDLERRPDGMQRLRYRSEGWQFWDWRDSITGIHRIHYISAGLEHTSNSPTILLVHGFGASAFHWRSNIPALVEAGYRVFAVDLLGFGWSDKAIVSYDDYSIWQRQLRDFVKDIVKDTVVVAGNSLGGYNSLALASASPELVSGVVLLNGAGRFEDLGESPAQQSRDTVELDPLEAPGQPVQSLPSPPAVPPEPSMMERVMGVPKQLATRVGLYVAFIYAKQPARIKQVLNRVYIDKQNVDDDLVTSIVQPAQDVRAAECFRLILSGSGVSINRLLRNMKAPLLLLWGELDPWIGPSSADRVMELYPSAVRIRLNAGHCPHDEAPHATNEGLLSWLATLQKEGKSV